MKSLVVRLKNDPRIRNSSWMILEKGISLFGLIFVISAMAKYVGPILYGYMALAASFFVLIKSISQMGLDQIYFKHVGKNKKQSDMLLTNMSYFILCLYFFLSLTLFVFIFYKFSGEAIYFFIATALAHLFMAIDIRAVHLDAILQSKFNVLSNLIGLIVSLFVRYFIINQKLDSLYFCFPIVLVTLIPFILRIYFIKKNNIISRKKSKKINLSRYSKYFVKVGFPLMISILSVNIYLQSANLYMGSIGMIREIGLYSIAVMLAGCWCFVPTTLIMSFLPKIYQTNTHSDYIIQAGIILRFLLSISFFIILFLWFFIEWFMPKMYGNGYIEAIVPFRIVLISSFFSIIGFFFYRMTMKFSGYNFLAKKMIATCIFNLIVTVVLIQKFGVIGAATAALLTEFFSNIVLNFLYKKIEIFNVFKYAILGKIS